MSEYCVIAAARARPRSNRETRRPTTDHSEVEGEVIVKRTTLALITASMIAIAGVCFGIVLLIVAAYFASSDLSIPGLVEMSWTADGTLRAGVNVSRLTGMCLILTGLLAVAILLAVPEHREQIHRWVTTRMPGR